MLLHASLPIESKRQGHCQNRTRSLWAKSSCSSVDNAVESGPSDLVLGDPLEGCFAHLQVDRGDEAGDDDGAERDFFERLSASSVFEETEHSPANSPHHQQAQNPFVVKCSVSDRNTSSLQGLQNIDIDAVALIRAWLRDQGFDPADEPHILTDEYIHSSLNQLKDGKPRTPEYATAKLLASLQWRATYGAAAIRACDVARPLAPGHMHWDGVDRLGRPILYARPALVDLRTYDRDEYLRAHVYLLEEGLRRMPAGVTQFVLVADAAGLGMKHLDAAFLRQLLRATTVGYPDRLGQVVLGPANGVVRCAWAGLSRLMPKGLAAKIAIAAALRPAVEALLPRGAAPPPWLSQ